MALFHGHPILASLFVASTLLIALTVTSPAHHLKRDELLLLAFFLALVFGIIAASVSLGIGLAH